MGHVDIDAFLRDGYAVVPRLFSPGEAETIREETIAEVERLAEAGDAVVAEQNGDRRISPRGDMLTYEPLRKVLLDPRVVEVAREVLGDTPRYWGESGVNVGALHGAARGWHTDASTTPVTSGPRFPLVRCGLYFQDTKAHSDGLALVAGSHTQDVLARTLSKRARMAALRWVGAPQTVLVGTSPGDLVIWDFRILHTGEVVRFKPRPSLALPLSLQGHLPSQLRLPEERRRVVMFPTFGLPGPDLDSWLAQQRTREYMRDIWRASTFPESVVDEAANAGLEVIRPVPEYGAVEAGVA